MLSAIGFRTISERHGLHRFRRKRLINRHAMLFIAADREVASPDLTVFSFKRTVHRPDALDNGEKLAATLHFSTSLATSAFS
jgi:hypothetical protein